MIETIKGLEVLCEAMFKRGWRLPNGHRTTARRECDRLNSSWIDSTPNSFLITFTRQGTIKCCEVSPAVFDELLTREVVEKEPK